MIKITFFEIMKSNYCKIVFLISFIVSYFLIPQKVFYEVYILLALFFMLVFSLTMTCVVRNIKEKFLSAKHTSSSIVSIIASLIGLSALQVCTIGAPVCGAVSISLIGLFLPAFFNNFLEDFSVIIIFISIIIQVISIYHMGCFKKN